MEEKHKWDTSMHRCSTKLKLHLSNPLKMKLQRKHQSKNSKKTEHPQEKRDQLWRASPSHRAVEWKSFSLNKHRRVGVKITGKEGGGDTTEQMRPSFDARDTRVVSLCRYFTDLSHMSAEPDDVDTAKPKASTAARLQLHQICLNVLVRQAASQSQRDWDIQQPPDQLVSTCALRHPTDCANLRKRALNQKVSRTYFLRVL